MDVIGPGIIALLICNAADDVPIKRQDAELRRTLAETERMLKRYRADADRRLAVYLAEADRSFIRQTAIEGASTRKSTFVKTK